MHSYKSVKTAPLYAIPTPSLIFSPWLATNVGKIRVVFIFGDECDVPHEIRVIRSPNVVPYGTS